MINESDEEDEELYIQLNMEHPFNIAMVEFMENNSPSVVSAYFARAARRGAFDLAMESIGGLTKFRRRFVVRSLVRMFRAGYIAGHSAGFDAAIGD